MSELQAIIVSISGSAASLTRQGGSLYIPPSTEEEDQDGDSYHTFPHVTQVYIHCMAENLKKPGQVPLLFEIR